MGEKLSCPTLKLRGPQSGMDDEWEKKLPEAYKPMDTYSGKFFSDWDWKKNKKNPYLRYDNLYNEKSNSAIYLYPRSPRMQYGLDLTKKLLYEIDKLCRANNSDFFIFYDASFHADQIVNEGLYTNKVQKVNNRFYIESPRQYKENQKYVNEGFRVFEISMNIKNCTLSDKDMHLNCEADTQLMRSLGDSLISYINRKK